MTRIPSGATSSVATTIHPGSVSHPIPQIRRPGRTCRALRKGPALATDPSGRRHAALICSHALTQSAAVV